MRKRDLVILFLAFAAAVTVTVSIFTGSKLEKTLRYMFAVQEEYLEAVYLKTEEIYGGFSAFLSKGLGCNRQTVEHLRKLYLQP